MAIFKKGDNYYIDYYFEGRRVREMVGPSWKQAQDALNARKGEIAQGKFELESKRPSPRLKDFSERYLEYSRANKKSHERDYYSLRHLNTFFGNKRLTEITPWLIEKYKLQRRKEAAPATVNRELACLKHLFSMAIKWGKAIENPGKKVKLFKEKNVSLRYLSVDEMERLIDNCNDDLRTIVVVALHTGMRKGELLGLTWDMVDLDQRMFILLDTKNDEIRKIPMTEKLTELFESLKLRHYNGWVFRKKDGTRYKNFDEAFRRAKEKAGLRNLKFHTLRHTFASHMVMSGADLVTVKELLGHKSIKMTMRYSHLSQEHKRKAIEVLGGHYMDTGVKTEEKVVPLTR
jgi:integrase